MFLRSVYVYRFIFFTYYRVNGFPHASLSDQNSVDIGKGLISEGYLLLEKRNERRLEKLVSKNLTFLFFKNFEIESLM